MYKFEFVEKVAIDNHLTIQGCLLYLEVKRKRNEHHETRDER
jgi:hypothetical protein